MKAKEITSVGYAASEQPVKNVTVYGKREVNSTVDITVDKDNGIFVTDIVEQVFTPSQWDASPYKEATLRDAALKFCKIDEVKDGDNVSAYKVTRWYRRLNGGMSVNSLLSKSRQMSGHATELSSLEGVVFSSVSSEKDLQLQFLAKAKEHYGWKADDEMKIKMRYTGEKNLTITPRNGGKEFTIKVQGWVFA